MKTRRWTRDRDLERKVAALQAELEQTSENASQFRRKHVIVGQCVRCETV